MSQSNLFKKIMFKKIQNKYAFILYQHPYNNPNKSIDLKICNSHHEVYSSILQFYINELYKTKTVIRRPLLKILNSKKSKRTKINAILLEFKHLFLSSQSLNINQFKFRLVKNDNLIYYKIIRKQLKTSKYKIQFTLKDYNNFYTYINNITF